MFTLEEIKKYLNKGAKAKRKHYRKDVKIISLKNSNWIMKIFKISLYSYTLIYDINGANWFKDIQTCYTKFDFGFGLSV